MKFITCLSLVFVTAVVCLHSTSADNEERDENHTKSSHESNSDRDEFEAFKAEKARKLSEHNRNTVKRIPAVRRVVLEDDGDHLHDEKSHTHSNDVEKDLDEHDRSESHGDRHFSDVEPTHVKYEREGYATEVIRPSAVPPLVLYGPQIPNIRRTIQLPVPAFRRPSYARVIDVAPVPVSYRSIDRLAYAAPRARNVIVGYQSPSATGAVRYAYGAPSNSYDNGIYPIEYIDDGYDGFLKKK